MLRRDGARHRTEGKIGVGGKREGKGTRARKVAARQRREEGGVEWVGKKDVGLLGGGGNCL